MLKIHCSIVQRFVNAIALYFGCALFMGGCAADWRSILSSPAPVNTVIVVDESASSQESGALEPLKQSVCQQVKEHTVAGDTVQARPFAAASLVSYAKTAENQLDILGMCKKLLPSLQREGIAGDDGTALHSTLETVLASLQDTAPDSNQGAVITVIIHADDQGTGEEEAIPLSATAALVDEQLPANASLVIFAIDGTLQHQLEAILQHPRVFVSPLTDDSIADSLDRAYKAARKPAESTAAGQS